MDAVVREKISKHIKQSVDSNADDKRYPQENLKILNEDLKMELLKNVYFKILRKITFFHNLSDEFLETLAISMEEVVYNQNEVIVKA